MSKNPISNVFNMDCIEAMKEFPDKFFELAIVDPPYGIGFSQYSNRIPNKKKGFTAKKLYEKKDWDNEIPTIEYFTELFRVSKNQIIWGGNYFTDFLPPSRGWIYWDKKISNSNNTNFSDGELAWTSFSQILRKFTYDWVGLGYLNNTAKEKKIHQTQKPIKLYEWLLKNYAQKGDKILDTHLGSQSSRIAAYKMGFDFWGYEIDVDYFKEGNNRFEDSIKMPLFDGIATKGVQLEIT